MNLETMRLLVAKGMSAADLLEIAEAMGSKDRSANAERQQRSQVPPTDAPWGAKARWGYEGPETPRLRDAEWQPLRAEILERDGRKCHYCREVPQKMCVDHVVPLSRGGTNCPSNLVACCVPCNLSKNDRLLSEWRGRGR